MDNLKMAGVTSTSEDLTVATMGHCLLCLVKLPPKKSKSSAEEGHSLTSLHNLSRYLRIDLKKLMQNRKVTISKQLKQELSMNKVGGIGIGIKGLLCVDCAFINAQFSEVYLQLEKIQMEMASSIKLIRWKLMEADEAGQAEFNQAGKFWREEVELVEALRKEAMEKCSTRLTSLLPPAHGGGDAKGDPSPEPDTEMDDDPRSPPKPKRTVDPSTGLVKCCYCLNKTFKDEVAFLRHFQDCHVGTLSTKSKCMDNCGAEFEDLESEREHWRLNYGVTYECYGCKEIFPNCCLAKHRKPGCQVLEVKASRLDCSCRLCRKGFTSAAAFQRHLGKFHKEKILPCSECGKRFKLPGDLASHRGMVHGIKGVPDRRIDVTINKTQLETDTCKEVAVGGGPAEPPMKMEALSSDEDHDMEDMATECSGAGTDKALFDTPAPLEFLNDMEYVVGSSEEGPLPGPESIIESEAGTFKCSLCPDSKTEYQSELPYKDHYKTEHLHIKFKCGSCTELFENRLKYVKHYRKIHLHIKWECFACFKRFQSRNQLRKHRSQHFVSKAGICSCLKCKKTFASFSSFRSHHRHAHEKSE